ADRVEPRASHACLIALAYTRKEAWPQAEIFLDTCHKRANALDREPEWVPQAEALIRERLASVNVAPISIATDPRIPDVALSVSNFAPDETFGPRTIHLPPGRHTIIARAIGFEDETKEISITDKSEQQVVVKMWKVGTRPKPVAPPSNLGKYLMYSGIGA